MKADDEFGFIDNDQVTGCMNLKAWIFPSLADLVLPQMSLAPIFGYEMKCHFDKKT